MGRFIKAGVGPSKNIKSSTNMFEVEDENQVKNLAAQALREQGYIVLEASSRIEALRVAEESPHTKIQLLLTDVVMPLMGGRELSEQLGAQLLEIRQIFMSGYVADAKFRREIEHRGATIVEKPFFPDEQVQ
jgi:CheY-like chemotaxis protein